MKAVHPVGHRTTTPTFVEPWLIKVCWWDAFSTSDAAPVSTL
jgi:hypothetical protein